jgi:adenosylcobinamide-GDP ribazoletransferase
MFLTRIPGPNVPWSPAILQSASGYFPWIGLILGILLGSLFFVGSWIWGPFVAACLVLAAEIWLTGAFHHDGFADTCDGYGGGWNKESILRILKDSRVGSFAASGLITLLLLKAALISQLTPEMGFVALILVHSLSRLSPLGVMWKNAYGGDLEHAKAKPLALGIQAKDLKPALIFGLVVLSLGLGIHLWVALATVAVLACSVLYFRRLTSKWTQGYTGDSLGACEQVSEVLILLVITANLPRVAFLI